MSTFGLLNTAYSGLSAARAALETTGQNVANVNTAGYTRQRVEQQSIGGVGNSALFTNGVNLGQGVQVTGISRLNDSLVDARVRDTASTAGYWTAASSALSTVETGLGEPGDTGLSTSLDAFWGAWQTMHNTVGTSGADGAASTLISAAQTLSSRLASGYTAASQGWSDGRSAAQSSVTSINDTAQQIASLNKQILGVKATGGNANELLDTRSTAIGSLAALTGATTRQNANGTVDVILGGSTMVSGTDVRAVRLTGAPSLASASTAPVQLEFADRPGAAVQVEGGTLAAQLTTLAPASGGTGGVYAETADAYNQVATQLATQVNAEHVKGQSSTGATKLEFFSLGSGTGPAALRLTVVPTGVAGIATASAGKGANDASNADTISGIGDRAGSPDSVWSSFVTRVGSQSKAAATQSAIADSSATTAVKAQNSQSGVDLDEETANLVVFQHAYQGAARVLTAVDEMLDTLINKTGLVGR